MSISDPIVASILTALLLLVPDAGMAQTEGENGDEDYSETDEPDGEATDRSPASGVLGATAASTASVVASLEAATKFCLNAAPGGFGVDCVAERLEDLSRNLEGQQGFEEIQAILQKTSKELNEIARANRSETARPAYISVTGETTTRTNRRLIPIDEAKKDIAVSQAIGVIDEAETLLLRSVEGSNERALQYQQIASALASNKVLLRSV